MCASHVVLEHAEDPKRPLADCEYMPKLVPTRLAVDETCVDIVGTFDVRGRPNTGMSYEWKVVASPCASATVTMASVARSQPLEVRQLRDDADSQPCISAAVTPTRSLTEVDIRPRFVPAMLRYLRPRTGMFALPRWGPVDEIIGAS